MKRIIISDRKTYYTATKEEALKIKERHNQNGWKCITLVQSSTGFTLVLNKDENFKRKRLIENQNKGQTFFDF